MKKTSKDWYADMTQYIKNNRKNEKSSFVIYDPDGWDRSNYEFSFNQEEIDKKEFMNRIIRSTVMCNLEANELIDFWIEQ